jgi:hypothetical protein
MGLRVGDDGEDDEKIAEILNLPVNSTDSFTLDVFFS